MRKSLLSFCFLTLMNAAIAQNIRFTDSTNSWEVQHYHEGSNGFVVDNYHLTFSGDTMVNGLTYRKLVQPYRSLNYKANLFREDMVAQKVWCRHIPYYSNDYDTVEYLIYSHNWQAGDTIKGYMASSTITGVDSVAVGTTWHKRFHIRTPNSVTHAWDLVEGIGGMGGPGFPVYPRTFEDGWILKCFTNQGSHPPVTPAASIGGYRFDNNLSCTLAVAENSAPTQLQVYPNPAKDEVNIRHAVGLNGVTFTVYDLTEGRLLHSK